MSFSRQPDDLPLPVSRPVGATELSWCRAVLCGTGITVLGLLLSKPPDVPFFQNALRRLQTLNPILNSKLHYDPTSDSFSFRTGASPAAQIQIQEFDVHSTSQILESPETSRSSSVPPFHLIVEHELNRNSWQNPDPSLDTDVIFASMYSLPDGRWVAALRLHTSVCDRASAVALLRGLLRLMDEGGSDGKNHKEREIGLGIEEYIPNGMVNKPFWARGMDVLGYSLNSFRFSNLCFKDTVSPRASCVLRLQLNHEETDLIMSDCECRKIKLFGVLAAAGLMASHSLKGIPLDQWEKYAVVTLMDCRPILDPALENEHIGFYHSAVLNTHDVKGGETLWELADRIYSSFTNAKNNNKHFTDMADINFLMCKAIQNPGLTPANSLRTSLVSVFEDVMIDCSGVVNQTVGLEDFIGCSSVHGVGPSLAIFDTIRDGKLDCSCVYPSPLHSREQMQQFVDEMKRLILARGNAFNESEQDGLHSS